MEERLNGKAQARPIQVDTAGACTAAEAYAAEQLIRYARLAWGGDFVAHKGDGLRIRVGDGPAGWAWRRRPRATALSSAGIRYV